MEVIIINNGSSEATDFVIAQYQDKIQLNHVKLSKNCAPHQWHRAAVLECKGDIVLPWLCDDDFLVESSVRDILELFSQSQFPCILGGFLRYDLSRLSLLDTPELSYLKTKPNLLNRITSGPGLIHEYCSAWGLGASTQVKSPVMSHASASFYRREILLNTIDKQKTILLGPIADVGLLGTHLHCRDLCFYSRPVVILGEGHPKQMDGSKKGEKVKFAHVDSNSIVHSPIKYHTFQNLGVESHLQVLAANNLYDVNRHYFTDLFYLNHIDQIIKCEDSWTSKRDGFRELRSFLENENAQNPVANYSQLIDYLKLAECRISEGKILPAKDIQETLTHQYHSSQELDLDMLKIKLDPLLKYNF